METGGGDPQARILRARVDTNPADTQARVELARYYERRGFPDVAIEHLRLACERDTESSAARVELAKVLRKEHSAFEAASVLRTFSEGHRNDVEVWAWLGVLEDEAGNWRAGEAASRHAVELAPKRDDLENNLGYSLLEQDRKSEAAQAFRAALAINSRSAIARNNLGLALTDNPREAMLNWQALEGPASAHNNMAAALIEAGNYAGARSEIQNALAYDPGHAAALNNLRLVSELDGKPAQLAAPLTGLKKESEDRRGLLAATWYRFRAGALAEKRPERQKDSRTTLATRQN